MSTRGTAVFRDIAIGASAIVIALTGLGFFGMNVANHALKWHDGVGMMVRGQNGDANDPCDMMRKGRGQRGPNAGSPDGGGMMGDRNGKLGGRDDGRPYGMMGDPDSVYPNSADPYGMMGDPNSVNPNGGGMMGNRYHNWGNSGTPPTS